MCLVGMVTVPNFHLGSSALRGRYCLCDCLWVWLSWLLVYSNMTQHSRLLASLVLVSRSTFLVCMGCIERFALICCCCSMFLLDMGIVLQTRFRSGSNVPMDMLVVE